ncbi:MAG TPA: protein-glutamate O-methyltransferase CheR [Pirellulales bacterium]
MDDAGVSPEDFAFIAKIVRDECALVLEPGKEYLVRGRLTPIAQKHGLGGVAKLIERLRGSPGRALTTEVIEAMLTTETSFFRDFHPFETLKNVVLPELIERRRGRRQLNIWCAASSSGQEPYSIALLLQENFPELASWRVTLSATDVSLEMLQRAQTGRYSQMEISRGLPADVLRKWFTQEGTTWRLDERVRSAVKFSQLNLAQPWPAMPLWDLVFLRNVMIYFDPAVKKAILGRVARVLQKDGYLLLGGSETTLSLDDSYARVERLKAGFYQLKPTGVPLP